MSGIIISGTDVASSLVDIVDTGADTADIVVIVVSNKDVDDTVLTGTLPADITDEV
jgi:hypothetical protein